MSVTPLLWAWGRQALMLSAAEWMPCSREASGRRWPERTRQYWPPRVAVMSIMRFCWSICCWRNFASGGVKRGETQRPALGGLGAVGGDAEHRHGEVAVFAHAFGGGPGGFVLEVEEAEVKFDAVDVEGLGDVEPLAEGHFSGEGEVIHP